MIDLIFTILIIMFTAVIILFGLLAFVDLIILFFIDDYQLLIEKLLKWRK